MSRRSISLSKHELKVIASVVLISMCGMLGIDIHLASLPYIMTYMKTDQVHMQQSVSLYLLGMGSSLLFYGPLSDKFGRKPIIIFGLTLASFASFNAAMTHSVGMFLSMRLLQGLGAGVCSGVGRTVIVDTLQGERLVIAASYFSMVIMLSPLLAPALGGYIQHWLGWQANFITLGVVLLMVMMIFAVVCPETNRFKNPGAFSIMGIYSNYRSLLKSPLFLGCTLMTGLGSASGMAYATTSSFILQMHFHVSPIMYGWLTTSVILGSILGRLFIPFFVGHFGRQGSLCIGVSFIFSAGILMSAFLFLHILNVPAFLFAVFFAIFGQAVIMPNSSSMALSPFHDKRGAAGAMFGSFQMLTSFVSSALVGLAAYHSVVVLSVAYVVLGFIGICNYRWVVARFSHLALQ